MTGLWWYSPPFKVPEVSIPHGAAQIETVKRIEVALRAMTDALRASAFSDMEISEINLNTRFSITQVIKNRARRSA